MVKFKTDLTGLFRLQCFIIYYYVSSNTIVFCSKSLPLCERQGNGTARLCLLLPEQPESVQLCVRVWVCVCVCSIRGSSAKVWDEVGGASGLA